MLILLVFLLVFVQLGLVSLAFGKLGLSTSQGMLLLFASLLGSTINLPITTIRAEPPDPALAERMQRSPFRLPQIPFNGRTLIAVNAGGCLVPLVFSASLVSRFPIEPVQLLIAISVTSVVCYIGSRPLPGIGIGMPILVAPITAALVAIFVGGDMAAPLAYICGTLGVIIGADLLRMKDVAKLGAPIASIGGAGTFDGIFLTGIVAVLLT
jgi:uncharacterized membrane protein